MNREQVKNILPIMQAFVEGKTIQCFFNAQWADTDQLHAIFQGPFASSFKEYRIKPERRTGWLNIYKDQKPKFHPTKSAAIAASLVLPEGKQDPDLVARIEIEWEEGEGL